MCAPMAALPMIMMATSTVAGVGAMYMQYQGAKDMGKHSAQMSKIKERDIENKAAADEQRARIEGAKKISMMKAQMAANGGTIDDLDSTNSRLLEDQAMYNELDVHTIRNNAERMKFGVAVESELAQSQAKNQANQAILRGIGQVAKGVSSTYNEYSAYKETTAPVGGGE